MRMTVMEAIQARRSIRSYEPRPVEAEKLRQVLEAGRLAPSARNQQNWKLIAVEDARLRQQLAAACCDQKQVAEAPVTLAVVATGHRVMTCGQVGEYVDCSIALSFMMLEAAEQGLGTCWLGAFRADEVAKILDLPEGDVVVAVSPLGYPAEKPAPRPRKEASEVVLLK